MKRHIIGLALFGFIVSAAAIVYALFSISKIIEIPLPNYSLSNNIYEKPIKNKNFKADWQVIKQAVFNLDTKMIYLTLYSNKLYKNDYEKRVVKFNFYTKTAEGEKLIASETYKYVPQSKFYGEAFELTLPFHCDWLEKINSSDNLYVIADMSFDNYNSDESAVFDSRSAFPVTLLSEKRNSFQH